MYDSYRTRYEFGLIDYGAAGDTVSYIIGPKGKKGFFWNVGVYDVTEVFAGSTLTPAIYVGTVADTDHYVELWDMGALAVASGGKSLRTTYIPGSTGWGTYVKIRTLPADTVVKVTHRAATGTPTGQAKSFLEVAWEK